MNNAIPVLAKRERSEVAFTLVELMVATGITVLLLILLFEISGNTLNATRLSRQAMDATQRGRAVLDALSSDLNGLVSQYGNTIFIKQDSVNNTEIAFITRNRGPLGTSNCRFMAVDYKLNANGRVIRKTFPVAWTDTNFMQDLGSVVQNANGSPLANSVLRIEAEAILDNGQIVPFTKSGAWLGTTINGQSLPTGMSGFLAVIMSSAPVSASTPRVQAVIMGMASMESQTYNLPNIQAMAAALLSPTSGQTPYDLWDQAIASGELNSFPKPAVAALRISQTTLQLK